MLSSAPLATATDEEKKKGEHRWQKVKQYQQKTEGKKHTVHISGIIMA